MNKSVLRTFIFVLITLGVLGLKTNAQTTGSLFMLQDNFRSQMINPSFMRFDDVVVIAIPGLAGGSFGNSGNFKFTDIIRRQANGEMTLDLDHYLKKGIASTSLSNWSTIPYFFVSVPSKEGRLSFYFKEQALTSIQFNSNVIPFFNNGNQLEEYKTVYADEINFYGSSYRELGVGYATERSDELTVGIRGKLLFGVVMADLRDWEYGIETSDNEDNIEFTSSGKGKFSMPYNSNEVISLKKGISKYMGSFENPGLAIDLGINYWLSKKSQLSVAVSDLGAIWFQNNSYKIDHSASFNFRGFDLTNTLDGDQSSDFIDSYDIVFNTTDSIRKVFEVETDTTNFFKALPPKTVIHYNYDSSEKLAFGVTNQTVFVRKNIRNILSLSSKQKLGSLSIFENINLHNINGVTFGGGLQWDASFFQLFFATDNILAFYHPANQKFFTASFGLSFLLRKPKQKSKDRKGNFSPWRPFYEKKKG
jgi:hypothetical protein